MTTFINRLRIAISIATGEAFLRVTRSVRIGSASTTKESLVVTTDQENGVAVVTSDNPPVNALASGVPEGIHAAIVAASLVRAVPES